jgi:hypothetical protein
MRYEILQNNKQQTNKQQTNNKQNIPETKLMTRVFRVVKTANPKQIPNKSQTNPKQIPNKSQTNPKQIPNKSQQLKN